MISPLWQTGVRNLKLTKCELQLDGNEILICRSFGHRSHPPESWGKAHGYKFRSYQVNTSQSRYQTWIASSQSLSVSPLDLVSSLSFDCSIMAASRLIMRRALAASPQYGRRLPVQCNRISFSQQRFQTNDIYDKARKLDAATADMSAANAGSISDSIKHDHVELKEFYENILGAQDSDSKIRWQNQFTWELARHSVGEELVLYPAMEEHLGEEGKKLADHDRKEHLKVCRGLNRCRSRIHESAGVLLPTQLTWPLYCIGQRTPVQIPRPEALGQRSRTYHQIYLAIPWPSHRRRRARRPAQNWEGDTRWSILTDGKKLWTNQKVCPDPQSSFSSR